MPTSMKRYDSLLIFALLLLLVFLVLPIQTIDVHIHDTYFVCTPMSFVTPFLLLLGCTWLLYRWAGKFIWSPFLVWIHVVITILSIAVIGILLPLNSNYLDTSIYPNSLDDEGMQFSAGFGFLALMSAQLILVVNFVIGAIRRILGNK